MDFDLTHEQRQILEYGNQVAQKFDRKYWMECAEKHEFPDALYRQVAEDGFVGTMVPEEYGGAGQGAWSKCTCFSRVCRTTEFRCSISSSAPQ